MHLSHNYGPFWEDIQALVGRQNSQVSLISGLPSTAGKAKQRSSQGNSLSGEFSNFAQKWDGLWQVAVSLSSAHMLPRT